MRKIFAIVGIACACFTSVAQAQANPVVIELYTSQGCSSCPPADQLLEKLAKMDNVIPLALHVDYWDYIGWKDSFANPAFTKRQRGYASAAGHRTIYTPQMIVGGVDHVVGYKPMELAELIQKHMKHSTSAKLDIVRTGDTLTVTGAAFSQSPVPTVVQMVRYKPSETVDIRRGENAGKSITYSNIVTEWTRIGEWDGTSAMALTVGISGSLPVVVVVQKPGQHGILAAARLR